MLMKQQAQTTMHLLETKHQDLEYYVGGETLEEICWEGIEILFEDYYLYTNFAIDLEEDNLEEFYFGKAVIWKKPVNKEFKTMLGFVTNSRLITARKENNLPSLLDHLEQPQTFWDEGEELDTL